MKKLSTQDRAALTKLASKLPQGSAERRAILAGLAKTGKVRAGFMKRIARELNAEYDEEDNSVWVHLPGGDTLGLMDDGTWETP
jgi:hypothetical protein